MRSRSSWPRRTLLGLTVVVGLIALFGLAVAGLLISESGQRLVFAAAAEAASAATGWRVELREPRLPSATRLHFGQLTLAEDDRVWLRLEEVRLLWRPLALLTGDVAIEAIGVTRLSLHGLPTADDGAGGPWRPPALPFGLQIAAVDIGQITLDPAVTGTAVTFAGRFDLKTSDLGTVTVDFALDDATRQMTTVTGKAVLSAASELTLEAVVVDRQDGILSQKAGVPALPDLWLRIDGGGPLADWHGQFTLAAEGALTARGDVGANLTGFSRAMLTADGIVQPAFLAMLGLPSLPTVHWALAVRQEGDVVTVERFNARAGASALTGHGAVTLTGQLRDVRLEGHAVEADWKTLLPPDFSAASARMEAHFAGTVSAPTAQVDLTLNNLALADAGHADQVTCKLSAAMLPGTEQAISTAGLCQAAGMSGDERLRVALGSAPRAAFEASFDEALSRMMVGSATLTGAALVLEGKGTVGLARTTPRLDGELVLRLPALQAFASFADVPLTGSATARVTARTATDGRVTGRLEIDAKEVIASGHAATALLRGPLRGSAAYALRGARVLTLSDIALSAVNRRVRGRGKIALDSFEIDADLELVVEEAAILSTVAEKIAEGPASLDVSLRGSPASLRVTGRMRGPRLTLGGIGLTALQSRFSAQTREHSATGTIAMNALAQGMPATMTSDFALRDGTDLDVERLRIDLLGLTAAGALRGDLAKNLWQGGLTVAGDTRLSVSALTDYHADGTMRARFDLSADAGKQAANIDLRVSDVALLTRDSAVLVDAASAVGRISDVFRAPTVELDLEISSVTSPAVAVERLHARLAGPLDVLSVSTTLTAEANGAISATAEGVAAVADGAASFRLDRFDGVMAKTEFRLPQPAWLRWRDDVIALEETRVQVGSGGLTLAAHRSASTLTAHLAAASLPLLPFATVFGGGGTSGLLDGRADLRWLAHEQALKAAFVASDLRLTGVDPSFPAGRLRIDVDWDGRALTANGDVSGFTEIPATFRAALPVHANDTMGEFVWPPDAAVAGAFRWDGEVAPIVALLPLSEHQLAGHASIAIDVAGTLANPQLSGTAALRRGRYEHLHWGTVLRDIELSAVGEPDGALHVSGTAHDGEGHALNLDGRARLAGDRGVTGAVRVTAADARVLRRDDLNGTMTADIKAEGNLEEVRLGGDVTVARLEIEIPDRLPASVAEIEVTEINVAGDGREPAPPFHGPKTRLDLSVALPGQVFVRGRGLDSEWKGALRITGWTRRPVIEGLLQAVRGTFSFAGRPFAIKSGTLRFRGEGSVDPEVDIVIEHSRGDFSAEIRFAGPLSKPALQLRSTPALPNDEIIARVVFGKSVRQLSPFQALQLAQSIGQISGAAPGGDSVLGKVRKLLGADVLTVEGDEETGPQVGVGKYVTERVYIGVRQGAAPGSGELTAEVEITPSISVQSEIGQNARGNVDLNWKFDY